MAAGMVRAALGLMSGTSLDGVDVAFLETDGDRVLTFGPVAGRAFAAAERTVLRAAIEAAATLTDRTARPGVLAEAEKIVTNASAAAVEAWRAANRVWKPLAGGRGGTFTAPQIDVVGFHGQTVLHRPQDRLTIQLGDGSALAKRLSVPVVYDFRAADVAAGGQGAPFVPAFHRALVASLNVSAPVAVLNVGGVANVTVLDGNNDPVACDVGPGNALIDDFVHERTGVAMDENGAIAGTGRANEEAVRRLLGMRFFALPPPKSLDRNAFRSAARLHAGLDQVALPDGAATLTAFTAAGGGAHRATSGAAAANLGRCRRWCAQSDAPEDAGGAARTGEGEDRRRSRLVGRPPRGAGLRLSRGARAGGPATVLSFDHRRAPALDRWRAGQALTPRCRHLERDGRSRRIADAHPAR